MSIGALPFKGSRLNRIVPLLFAAALTVGACAEPVAPIADLAAPSAPSTIVNGTPDYANAWPAVGALMWDRNGNGQYEATDRICTGSLISDRILLTSAHCLAWGPAAGRLAVSFDPDLTTGTQRLVVSSYSIHPNYRDGNESRVFPDMAVVVLSEPVGITPMLLPALGVLDQLRNDGALADAWFLNIGYGVEKPLTGRPVRAQILVRQVSRSPFSSLISSALGTLMNQHATGGGGFCNGDSGGPQVLDRDGYRNIVLGVAMTIDIPCRAGGWSIRVDTPEARSFLAQFVPLP